MTWGTIPRCTPPSWGTINQDFPDQLNGPLSNYHEVITTDRSSQDASTTHYPLLARTTHRDVTGQGETAALDRGGVVTGDVLEEEGFFAVDPLPTMAYPQAKPDTGLVAGILTTPGRRNVDLRRAGDVFDGGAGVETALAAERHE